MKENLTKNLKKKKGFTLIELIIVIAILAIIAVIAIPKFGQVQKNAKISSDKTNAKTLANAISKEITDEKIKIDGTNPITAIDFSTANSATNPVDQVKNSIQSIPTPKYDSNAHFAAVIEPDGDVIINVVSTSGTGQSATTTTTQIYPTPSSPYNQ